MRGARGLFSEWVSWMTRRRERILEGWLAGVGVAGVVAGGIDVVVEEPVRETTANWSSTWVVDGGRTAGVVDGR